MAGNRPGGGSAASNLIGVSATVISIALLISGATPGTGASATGAAVDRGQPPITYRWIPFGAKRRSETAAYSMRHYGVHTWHLKPRLIVEHWTQTRSAAPVLAEFRSNRRDTELHERPGLCAHFLIDRNGVITQLVPLNTICRHAVGLNDRAIGIEHVGMSDGDVMGNSRQLSASLRLTRWLRCRYRIGTRDVIGHSESLGSRFHHERIARLRKQTHDDMRRQTMIRYRKLVDRQPCPRSA